MKAIQNAIKACLFVFILFLLMTVLGRILSRPHGASWASETGLDLIHKWKGQYDVCFAGTSIVIANISNQELYEKYGIKSVSVGEPEQPLYLTKYTVKEVLRYQKPKAIVVDCRSLFYDEERILDRIERNEDYFVHYSLDSIRSWSIKSEAVKQISKQYKKIDAKEYFFRIFNRHSQWKNLNERNFLSYEDSSCMNGNVMLTDLHNVTSSIESLPTVSDENKRELIEIKKDCEEHNADLILMMGYIEPDSSKREQARQVAENYHISFLDLNEALDDIEFEEDMVSDYIHLNVVGAAAWSDYVGHYLIEKYSFDKCNPGMKQFFDSQGVVYDAYKNNVYNKMKFSKDLSFKEFLNEISQVNISDILVFVAVCDDAYMSLDAEAKQLLIKIGLDGPSCFRGSYAGVVLPDEVNQKSEEDKKVIISGEETLSRSAGIMQYVVESSGANCVDGQGASIVVNGEEYAKNQRGLNFVIFDTYFGSLITSKCFDTFSESDPGSDQNSI